MIKYRRKIGTKLTTNIECSECDVVWNVDDEGDKECPFCGAVVVDCVEVKLPTPKPKKNAVLNRKLLRLEERVGIIDALLVTKENTPIMHHEGVDGLRARHAADLNEIGALRRERTLTLGKITDIRNQLSKTHVYIEPKGIRLPDGQMDWDAAYKNMREYRDKLGI